jgi:NAD(P)-dependent dehydrogenase (short-subunit alcohol dehydrogenase family)
MAEAFPPQHQDRQPGREAEMVPEPEYIRPTYRGAGRLRDRVAIITGGDSGIGRSIAVHFAREGANLVLAYLEEDRDARATQALAETEGADCLLFKGDLGEASAATELVEAAVERFERIDILVNNAAEQHSVETLEELSVAQWNRTFATNIDAYFYVTRAALPHMPEGAAVINTASVNAYKGNAHLIAYTATKGAIVAFTRSIALTLAPRHIRVNAVAPGPVWTPLIPASFSAGHVAQFGKEVPMGRAGQPSEIAPSYVFLASADASYMTGQVLHPNGGTIVNA